jgi:hypothetical protein
VGVLSENPLGAFQGFQGFFLKSLAFFKKLSVSQDDTLDNLITTCVPSHREQLEQVYRTKKAESGLVAL